MIANVIIKEDTSPKSRKFKLCFFLYKRLAKIKCIIIHQTTANTITFWSTN